MILDFTEEVDEILAILRIEFAISPKQSVEVMAVLVKLLDRGMAAERSRIIDIIQRFGMNPMPLVEKIRKPIR